MNAEQAAALRAPFPKEAIGKIPKAGTWLDYVGHAAVRDRLLQVDPDWTWEPAAWTHGGDDYFGPAASPLITQRGNDSVMWIRLTVCGVSRLGVGIVQTKAFELEKQLISDAIRNAAMSFGVALDLWSKEDLGHDQSAEAGTGESGTADRRPSTSHEPPASSVPKHKRDSLKARCVALQAADISIADERERLSLPLVDSCNAAQAVLFEQMLDDLEAKIVELEKPFDKAEAK